MASLLLPAVFAVLVVFWLLGYLFSAPYDPQEPPLVKPKIPFIGHIIGLLRHGTRYYSMIATTTHHPIFTLPVPRGKMYIVTSPSLIAACDRRGKVVSFAPYVVEFGKRILAGSAHSVGLLSEDLLEEKGPHGSLRTETMAAMHRSQVPGPYLDEMMRVTLVSSVGFVDETLLGGGGAGEGVEVGLFAWVKRFMTVAGTDAVYGAERNPFHDPEVADSFWAVDKDFALLGMMFLPDLLAPKGSRGRKRFFQAFREYYASGGLETASYLIKARHEANKKYGISDDDIARFDLGVCTALLVNTVPAMGWMLCHAFSNATLLATLRSQIEAVVFPNGVPPPFGTTTNTATKINIHTLTTSIPLLESFVREVLRVQSNSASARFVLRDTLLRDDTTGASYLVKKDCFLGMPSAPVHGDQTVWGPDAGVFDPERFLPERVEGKKKVPASAWRTFGGGNALCPGRHLALREIMSVLVVLVLRCEIEPYELGKRGPWRIPAKRHHISTSILTPKEDIKVRIRPREGLEHVRWEFVWEDEATGVVSS
ncbi:cytochrome P450 [Dichotomopilus funicola]|uniref:Cytochrome P450 n=1 Tax=Dichotomopilus funicola TaxID=1934379 RepID=A0AAN6V185_9PEZI|nr:cytochrome P450 [Dichotomopilus funicola]